MISLLPSSPASDTNGAYAIIAMAADPAASKKRLDELVAQAKLNEEKLAEANAAQAKAAQDQATAKQTLDGANQVLNDLVASNRATADELAAKQAKLNAALNDVYDRTAALDAAEKTSNDALAKREVAVAAREARAQTLIDKATSDAAAAATMRAELERKLSQLKALAS